MEQVTEQVIKKLTLDVVANLRRAASEGGTPVKTGWARANWMANVGGSTEGVNGDPNAVAAAEGAQQAALGSVLAYKLAGGPVFITNNVPYILKLNEGSSKQAAAGFVQRAIQEAVTGLRSVAA